MLLQCREFCDRGIIVDGSIFMKQFCTISIPLSMETKRKLICSIDENSKRHGITRKNIREGKHVNDEDENEDALVYDKTTGTFSNKRKCFYIMSEIHCSTTNCTAFFSCCRSGFLCRPQKIHSDSRD